MHMKRIRDILLAAIVISTTACGIDNQPKQRPNIILIMVDDMGYSDIGSYGGEIPTPNIDGMAGNGIRFTRFYNTSRCCPTRASLLTGLYPHETGIGHMTSEGPFDFDYGEDGYRGNLNQHCVTLAEVLGDQGYHTYMTGKWHLGSDMEDRPLQRGFEKYYGSLRGAFNYFKPGDKYMWGNELLEQPDPTKYYTTDAFTDTARAWIAKKPKEEPFFLYLAYNAPHWPLHAKSEDVDKFIGKYMIGWDSLRQARFHRQVEMGLFDKAMGLSPRDSNVRPWSEVTEEQKKRSDYRMAVYAAQVFSVDENIGKLINTLKETGQFDNTLIMFLSDNGACAEPYNEFGGGKFSEVNNPDFAGARSVGRGWANAANTPLNMYKNRPYEGGIATPFIAHWPKGINGNLKGKFVRDMAHIRDVMPTVLELTNGSYTENRNGNKVYRLSGQSLTPFFTSGTRKPAEYQFFEHENRCAAISGNWKIVADFGSFNWELYDLENDRIEQNNLAAKHPEIVARMSDAWQQWAKDSKVIPKGNSDNKGYKSPKPE